MSFFCNFKYKRVLHWPSLLWYWQWAVVASVVFITFEIHVQCFVFASKTWRIKTARFANGGFIRLKTTWELAVWTLANQHVHTLAVSSNISLAARPGMILWFRPCRVV